ncbi:hypothetical protein N665_0396s0003, partial [Sinapis alba]
LTKYDVEVSLEDGVGTVNVPEEVFQDASPLWEDFLIGNFLEKAPHIAKIHAIVNKIWKMGVNSQMIEVFEINAMTMKFRIGDPVMRNRVLRRGMWNLAEVPVVMSKWSPFPEDSLPEKKAIPMWIHLKNIPRSMFSWKGLSFAASPIGIPDRLHPETAQCLNMKVAKIFVKADLTKELPKSMNFNFQGKETRVDYIYPWLPTRCMTCKKWGHSEKVCSGKGEQDGNTVEERGEGGGHEAMADAQREPASTTLIEVETQVMTEEVMEEHTVSVTEKTITETNENQEGWSDVSPGKACRTPEKSKSNFEVGHISINSRFSVLSQTEEEGEIIEEGEKENSEAEEKSTNGDERETLDTEQVQGTDEVQGPGEVQGTEDHESPESCAKIKKKHTHLRFNKLSKQDVVRDWIKKNSFQFGCIIETRVKESRAGGIVSSVCPGWSTISNYEHNRLGRIWVLWGPKVRVTPCYKSGQLITCSILFEGSSEEVFCSFVYAYNTQEARRELWDELKTHQDSAMMRNKPWLVFGDFNEILEIEEHSGQGHLISAGMREFKEIINYCSMTDTSYQGPKLTWCNKRDDDLICKKLDRTLMNDKWAHQFPGTYSVFESGGCSDHLRCRIVIQDQPSKPRRPFKFTNATVDSPDFLKILQEYWSDTDPLFNSTSALFRLAKKLKNLKPLLRSLSKKTVCDITKKTKEAWLKLCECQTKTLSNPSQSLMKEEAKLQKTEK